VTSAAERAARRLGYRGIVSECGRAGNTKGGA
jgi:hypothetical protein